MDKTQTQQKTNTTCPCGEKGQKQITATLKSGTVQTYCSDECKEQDVSRQKKCCSAG